MLVDMGIEPFITGPETVGKGAQMHEKETFIKYAFKFGCVMSVRREMFSLRHLTLSAASCRLPARIVTPLSVPGMRWIDPRY